MGAGYNYFNLESLLTSGPRLWYLRARARFIPKFGRRGELGVLCANP